MSGIDGGEKAARNSYPRVPGFVFGKGQSATTCCSAQPRDRPVYGHLADVQSYLSDRVLWAMNRRSDAK